MNRFDDRAADELRPVRFRRNYAQNADGSVLVEVGRTKVLCTVCASSKVPLFQKSRGQGWMTAEYSMLPGSVPGRKARETASRDGRSVEIQRLIGRALRSVIDLSAFPEHTLHVDCDVLQADGGTRCASITGAAVALHDALRTLSSRGQLRHWPLRDWPAAVSVGLVAGQELLDLDYGEDFEAGVDMNVVATAQGRIIEVQGTAEGLPFEREVFDRLVDLGLRGVAELTALQKAAVEAGLPV
ncbi:MAG: ribonuclease PH [Planctomycetes bacterium]|nr:ribonuclease PH [Planctomycetota bacterium]MBL7007756.1 ribonuclease PH [Planctomycetota bacterium]